MTNEEFRKLCHPVNMLIGYAQSASELDANSDFTKWSKRLMEHADSLRKAWNEVI